MKLLDLFQQSPNAALLLCICGLLLIYFELNRPGSIVPGCVGLAFFLVGVAALLHVQLAPFGIACLAVSTALLIYELRQGASALLTLAVTLGIILGCLRLVRGPEPLHIASWAALVSGILIGPGTSILTAVAHRARVNKGLD